MRPVVIFDGDDTLWLTEPLYDSVRDSVAEHLARRGVSGDAFREVQAAADLARVGRYGYSWLRFPGSSYLAARRLGGSQIAAVGALLRSFRVFWLKAPINRDARGVLEQLADDYRLVLLTKGERRVQQRRVRQSGLAEFFDEVRIVSDKTSALFAEVASGRPTVSIGNSLRADIYPALQSGCSAVHVPAHVWQHELDPTPSAGGYSTISTLAEVPAAVRAAVPVRNEQLEVA